MNYQLPQGGVIRLQKHKNGFYCGISNKWDTESILNLVGSAKQINWKDKAFLRSCVGDKEKLLTWLSEKKDLFADTSFSDIINDTDAYNYAFFYFKKDPRVYHVSLVNLKEMMKREALWKLLTTITLFPNMNIFMDHHGIEGCKVDDIHMDAYTCVFRYCKTGDYSLLMACPYKKDVETIIQKLVDEQHGEILGSFYLPTKVLTPDKEQLFDPKKKEWFKRHHNGFKLLESMARQGIEPYSLDSPPCYFTKGEPVITDSLPKAHKHELQLTVLWPVKGVDMLKRKGNQHKKEMTKRKVACVSVVIRGMGEYLRLKNNCHVAYKTMTQLEAMMFDVWYYVHNLEYITENNITITIRPLVVHG